MNTRHDLLRLALMFVCSSSLWASDCTNAPSGLVGWWPGEGNGNDSVNLNTGTLEGGVGFSTGYLGQAFSFNGTTSDVRVSSSTNLDVGSASGFTVEAWIAPASVAQPQPLLQWKNPSPLIIGFGVTLWISLPAANGGGGPGCIAIDLKANSLFDHRLVSSAPGFVTPGGWQHIAATYDKANGYAALYFNGSLIATTNIGSFSPLTKGDLWLGRHRVQATEDTFYSIGNGAAWFGGLMDEISIYDRALSQIEVQRILSAGASGKCPLPTAKVVVKPSSLTLAEGGTGTFSALANGSPPITFQWSANGTNIIGATNASLVLTNVQFTDAGNYAVQATNLVGSTISSNASVVVLPAYAPTWVPTSAPTNQSWVSVACSADGKKLVAASYSGSIYTSTDFGVTWSSNTVATLVWKSVVSSVDGSKIIAAGNIYPQGGGLYGSTNSGTTWEPYVSGDPWDLLATSADGVKLAGTSWGSIHLSTNSGVSWVQSSAPSSSWRALQCSADGSRLVASAGTDLGSSKLYISANSGGNWNQVTMPPSNLWQRVSSSADGVKLAAASHYEGSASVGPIYCSTNSGLTWWLSGAPRRAWNAIACSADGTKLVAAAIDEYLYISTDGGLSWTATRVPKAQWISVASSADGTRLVAAAWDGGIYTWTPTALEIKLATQNLIISWPTNVPGFILQQKINTSLDDWSNVTNVPTIADSRFQVILPTTAESQVFRLMYP